MVKPLILFAGDDRLEIVPEAEGWAKCFLVGDDRIYLGADDLDVFAGRLHDSLAERPSRKRQISGEIDGHRVWWVLSLAEAHHVLFAARTEDTLLLFWQNAHQNPVTIAGVMPLSPEQRQQWRSQLEALLLSLPINRYDAISAAEASRELARK